MGKISQSADGYLLGSRTQFDNLEKSVVQHLTQAFMYLSLIMLLLCSSISAAYGDGKQKTYVLITIDHCETWPGIVFAKANGNECGIKALIDICDRNGVKPTFFFSPYDYRKVGEEKVKFVAKYIADRGCDIHLHTHPHHLYDPNRNNMYQYSLGEQIEIIRHGKEKIYEWTGCRPIAHRAGGYSANLDTLRALAINQIYFDSSSFYKEPRSKISFEGLPMNVMSRIGQIVEIPVSVFELQEFTSLFYINLPYLRRIRKVDIDWADYAQIKHAMVTLKNKKVLTITLFLHFHSLLNPANDIDLTKTKPDLVDIEEFDAILKMIIQSPGFKIVTFKELIDIFNKIEERLSPKKDFLPVYKKKISLIQYGRKVIGINSKNVKYILLLTIIISVTSIVGFILNQKLRKRK